MSNGAGYCCTPWASAACCGPHTGSIRVREALLAMQSAGAFRCGELSAQEDRIRVAVLRTFADHGHAPTTADLATRVGLSESELGAALASLEARDIIVREKDTGRIVGAYPFTEAHTEHQVHLGALTVNAMCAIDALGTGAMFNRDVRIRSSCRMCGAPIELTTRNCGKELAPWTPETAIVWSGIRYEHRCAADSLCKVLAFFCTDKHLAAWRQEHSANSPGFRLSMEEGLEAGRALFEHSLNTVHSRATTT